MMQWPAIRPVRYLGNLAALLLIVFGLVPASRAATEMQEFMVPASDPGIQLYVRNKHLAGKETFTADRVLIYVQGATYPSETMFDLRRGVDDGRARRQRLGRLAAGRAWLWTFHPTAGNGQAGGGQQTHRGHRDGCAGRGEGEPDGLVVGNSHRGPLPDHKVDRRCLHAGVVYAAVKAWNHAAEIQTLVGESQHDDHAQDI